MADHAPLVLGFLLLVFIQPNRRAMPAPELTAHLDAYLDQIRETHGPQRYPRRAREYLDEWSSPERSWLRKYYPRTGEDAEFDLTPAAERAIEWVRSLTPTQFVGTESRLLTLLHLLRDLAAGSQEDPAARIKELERRKRRAATLRAAVSTRADDKFLARWIENDETRNEEVDIGDDILVPAVGSPPSITVRLRKLSAPAAYSVNTDPETPIFVVADTRQCSRLCASMATASDAPRSTVPESRSNNGTTRRRCQSWRGKGWPEMKRPRGNSTRGLAGQRVSDPLGTAIRIGRRRDDSVGRPSASWYGRMPAVNVSRHRHRS